MFIKNKSISKQIEELCEVVENQEPTTKVYIKCKKDGFFIVITNAEKLEDVEKPIQSVKRGRKKKDESDDVK